jgi:hypothetical protein
MKWSLVLLMMMMSSCVVRQYGGGAAAGSAASTQLDPVDFSTVESRLEELIAAETENVDRRDRLEAAWELCQETKTQRPAAQHVVHRYLLRVVEVEKRVIDAGTDAVAAPGQQTFVPIASIQAERIAGSDAPTPVPASARQRIVPPDSGAQAVMSAARERMGSGDLDGALAQLDVCTGQPCGAATITLWREVRDRLVYQGRESAGQQFLDARSLGDPVARRDAYQSIVNDLNTLQARFPDSRYKEGVASSIATVTAALSEEGT